MELQTDRLVLRELGPEHAADGFRLYGDPRVAKYLGGTPPVSVEDEAARFAGHRERYWDARGYGLMAVFQKSDGAFVGICGHLRWEIDGAEEVEVAYALLPEHWGKGYATEAARALAQDAFDRLGCRRVISLVMPENAASAHVAVKNGMHLEREWMLNGKAVSLYARSRDPFPSA